MNFTGKDYFLKRKYHHNKYYVYLVVYTKFRIYKVETDVICLCNNYLLNTLNVNHYARC